MKQILFGGVADKLRENEKQTIMGWLLSQRKTTSHQRYPAFGLWKPVYLQTINAWPAVIDQAIAGGFAADRVAYAFAAGYQGALRTLVPDLPDYSAAAFCVTEEGGGHPRAIQTRLAAAGPQAGDSLSWRMSGQKMFITNALEADYFLIAASTGKTPDGRNQIRMVHVQKDTQGVVVRPMPDLPFIPEISHGILELDGVPVREAQLLPGDGYLDFIKPFRTIEDIYVSAAVAGYLFQVAVQFAWPREIRQKLLALIAGFRSISRMSPKDPAAHVVLGELLGQLSGVVESLTPCWEKVDPELRNTWDRDKKLLGVARKARTKRLETAWASFDNPMDYYGPPSPPA